MSDYNPLETDEYGLYIHAPNYKQCRAEFEEKKMLHKLLESQERRCTFLMFCGLFGGVLLGVILGYLLIHL